MRKLFIADDEEPVIRHLTTTIDWAKNDIEVVGTACDGSSALQGILATHPDVVITDIRMPSMSGLDMIERVFQQFPNVRFLIYSGYSEFQLVRKALLLRVEDYLVKPESNERILNAVLGILRDQNAAKPSAVSDSMKQIKLLLIGDDSDIDQSRSECCLIATLELRSQYINTQGIASLLQRSGLDFEGPMRIHDDCLFVFWDSLGKQNAMVNTIRSTVNKLDLPKEEICSFGIGSIVEYGQIKKSYAQSRQACAEASFYHVPVVTANTIRTDYSVRTDFRTDAIYTALAIDNNFTELHKLILDETDRCVRAYISPEYFTKGILDTYYGVNGRLQQEFGINERKLNRQGQLPSFLRPQTRYGAYELAEDLVRIFREYGLLLQTLQSSDQKEKILYQLKTYMNEHIGQPVSLNELAGLVNFSPGYISNLFSSMAGTTITEYLLNLRMERAKQYLACTTKKIQQIARMVGYDDQRYFCQVFKKHSGMTASEYRRQYSVKG